MQWKLPQLWATGDWQLHHDNVPSHISHLVQSFLAKHQIAQVTQAPCSPVWCPVTSGFSQNSNHLWKGRDFKPSMKFRKIWWQLMAIPTKDYAECFNHGKDTGRTVWGPKECTLKGPEVSLSCVQCFLYLVSSSINVSIFHSTWLDTFGTGYTFLHTHIYSLFIYVCIYTDIYTDEYMYIWQSVSQQSPD